MAKTTESFESVPVSYVDESGTIVGSGHTTDYVFRGAVLSFDPSSPCYELLRWETEQRDGVVLGIVRAFEE
jgi:hypothetical protein